LRAKHAPRRGRVEILAGIGVALARQPPIGLLVVDGAGARNTKHLAVVITVRVLRTNHLGAPTWIARDS